MVDALAELAPDLIDISLRIQKIAERPLAALVISGEESEDHIVVATVRANRDGKKINISIIINSNQSI